jgi:pimeloyl-ACP methyl ester carboxylesterase
MTTSGAGAPSETSTVATPEREPVTPAGLDVRTQYARNDAANIAYQMTGEGRRDLVIVPGFVSHVEHCWTHPPYARFIRRLASMARVTVFDKRGSGLSDPLVGEPSLEERTDDVSAVMDAAGLGHATVMGISDGAAVAALFAAMNPERVDGLIVYGGFERALSAPDYPWAVTAEELSLLLEAIVGSWGEGVSLGYLASEHANDEVLRQWWAGFERLAASPGQARAALGLYGAIDLREVLPSVQAPTLVIHRTEDILPVEGARRFATRIPGARFVELPGDDHWPWIGDADDLLPELERFLAAEPRAPEPDRVLATVLFADLPSSVLHEQLVRQELGSHRGRVLALDDRGVLASFDRPARGIRCACAIRDAARDAGVHVRAGLHAGECERLGDGLDGHAVRIGTSIGRLADPGEVLVSSTVKDLVAGSPLAFEDRGAHVFDGALGEWRLYAVAGARAGR